MGIITPTKEVQYEFNAKGLFTSLEGVENHLKSLTPNFPALFEDIDIQKLKFDPDAVNILTSACRVIHETVERYNKNPNAPFYLGLGERHAAPADKIHQMLVLKGISAENFNIIPGREFRESSFIQRTAEYFDAAPEKSKKDIHQAIKQYNDEYTDFSLLYYFSQTGTAEDPYGLALLNLFLLKNTARINTTQTDTPLKFKNNRECSTIDTSRLPKHLSSQLNQEDIHAKSALGMWTRNEYSLTKLKERYNQSHNKKTIMVDIAGMCHLFEDKKNATGKLEIAKNRGWLTLGHIPPPLISNTAWNTASSLGLDRFWKTTDDTIITPNLPNNRYKFQISLSAYDINKNLNHPKIKKMVEYTNTKMKTLGLGDIIPTDLSDKIKEIDNRFWRHIETINSEIHPNPN